MQLVAFVCQFVRLSVCALQLEQLNQQRPIRVITS